MQSESWVTAEEAARLLGVTRQTLYSYVSRGIVVKQPAEVGGASRFSRSAVTALAADRRRGRRPADVARAALDWGVPVLESEITLIESGHLFYRGHDAVALSHTATIEDVAELLWRQAAATAPVVVRGDRGPAGHLPGDILARFTASARQHFAPSWQQDEARVAEGCSTLMRTMTRAVLDLASLDGPIGDVIAQHWHLGTDAADLVRRALVLCADHDLNPSTFTVRCIASTGADLPAALAGGLAALSGTEHGGATTRVSDFLAAVPDRGKAGDIVERALENGTGIPGFGHPLYPAGDPRAAALIAAMADRDPVADAVLSEASRIAGLRPNLDFALVALSRSLNLPPGSAFGLFTIGRTAGWIAHALEQRSTPGLIRPRARYTGDRP